MFVQTIQSFIRVQTLEAATRLDALRQRLQTFATEIDNIQSNEGYYQDEVNYIIDNKSGNIAGGLAHEAANFIGLLGGFTGHPNDITIGIIQSLRREFDKHFIAFQSWVTNSPVRIREIRSDLNAAG